MLVNNRPIIGIQISTGGDTSCAILAAVTYCWGRDDQGQAGINRLQDTVLIPTKISGF